MIDAGILDTNIFLRVIAQDQPDQAPAAKELLDRIARGEIAGTLLPTVVLEIIFVLERQYASSREEVFQALDVLLDLENLDVVDGPQLRSALEVYRRRRSVSFADAYHCAMARDFHEGSLVSFDRKLDGVPGVTRRGPASFGRAS